MPMTAEPPRSANQKETPVHPAANTACRFCGMDDLPPLVDLGMSPLCETFLTEGQLEDAEYFDPLTVRICPDGFLVQLREHVSSDDIFTEYAHFFSCSDSWLDQDRRYCDAPTARFPLGTESFVIELSSNDGYLLWTFIERGIWCLGIEPAAIVAKVAIDEGTPTRVEAFSVEYARKLGPEGVRADQVAGNNVLAQVPDLNDFVGGIQLVLAPGGVVTIEWQHVLRLMRENQIDTIYHERSSNISLLPHKRTWERHGIRVFDVEDLPTHGGSFRVYDCYADNEVKGESEDLLCLRPVEVEAGLDSLYGYAGYTDRVERTKRDLLSFRTAARGRDMRVASYGAPGKGDTLLKYCGVRTVFLDCVVDQNPYKDGRFFPGTHNPIYPTERLAATKPHYILMLVWNLRHEIAKQFDNTRQLGARLAVPIPELEILE